MLAQCCRLGRCTELRIGQQAAADLGIGQHGGAVGQVESCGQAPHRRGRKIGQLMLACLAVERQQALDPLVMRGLSAGGVGLCRQTVDQRGGKAVDPQIGMTRNPGGCGIPHARGVGLAIERVEPGLAGLQCRCLLWRCARRRGCRYRGTATEQRRHHHHEQRVPAHAPVRRSPSGDGRNHRLSGRVCVGTGSVPARRSIS